MTVFNAQYYKKKNVGSFTTVSGVRQECLLAPLLFLIEINEVSLSTNDAHAGGIV